MSSPLYLFYEAVAVTATAATLPLLLELLITGVGNLLPRRMVGGVNPCDAIRLHVLVPAYNEALLIQRTVGSLRASNLLSAESSASIIVIAHNCTDATALLAEAAGAVVLRESGPAGKGYAVEFGFAHAKTHGATHVTVIDADSTVSENLIGETIAAFKRGADATQVRYELDDMNDPKADARRTLQGIAFSAFNLVRARGRAGLGLSSGIFGNGFALSLKLVE